MDHTWLGWGRAYLTPLLPGGPLLLVLVFFLCLMDVTWVGWGWGVGGILKVGTLSFFAYLIIVITAHACGNS